MSDNKIKLQEQIEQKKLEIKKLQSTIYKQELREVFDNVTEMVFFASTGSKTFEIDIPKELFKEIKIKLIDGGVL